MEVSRNDKSGKFDKYSKATGESSFLLISLAFEGLFLILGIEGICSFALSESLSLSRCLLAPTSTLFLESTESAVDAEAADDGGWDELGNVE